MNYRALVAFLICAPAALSPATDGSSKPAAGWTAADDAALAAEGGLLGFSEEEPALASMLPAAPVGIDLSHYPATDATQELLKTFIVVASSADISQEPVANTIGREAWGLIHLLAQRAEHDLEACFAVPFFWMLLRRAHTAQWQDAARRVLVMIEERFKHLPQAAHYLSALKGFIAVGQRDKPVTPADVDALGGGHPFFTMFAAELDLRIRSTDNFVRKYASIRVKRSLSIWDTLWCAMHRLTLMRIRLGRKIQQRVAPPVPRVGGAPAPRREGAGAGVAHQHQAAPARCLVDLTRLLTSDLLSVTNAAELDKRLIEIAATLERDHADALIAAGARILINHITGQPFNKGLLLRVLDCLRENKPQGGHEISHLFRTVGYLNNIFTEQVLADGRSAQSALNEQFAIIHHKALKSKVSADTFLKFACDMYAHQTGRPMCYKPAVPFDAEPSVFGKLYQIFYHRCQLCKRPTPGTVTGLSLTPPAAAGLPRPPVLTRVPSDPASLVSPAASPAAAPVVEPGATAAKRRRGGSQAAAL